MSKIISHELSKFGKLKVALHNESAIFYEQLERDGIIDYLKNLEHLGFISKSHPGNNHKRWDYVILQLYILHKLKDKVFKVGLSSNHKCGNGNETSGLVILQIAVLFANVGHLKGTLSSEIGLMNFLEKNESYKDDFLYKIDQKPRWKKFSDDILINKEYYKIKYIIALNYILENNTKSDIENIIYAFFERSMIDDESNLRKLKWIFHKVRQISFLYLDSFNSDFPFHIDISKILMNTWNYKTVFNPNSFDFDDFYDSCETTLTKKLYISEYASLLLEHNKKSFAYYLSKEIKREGNNKLNFKNFLYSLISRNVKPFEITSPQNQMCLQFYLSKEDIDFFGIKQKLFNYKEAYIKNYKNENFLSSLLNKGLSEKKHSVSLIHDGRKSMYFNNLIVDIEKISSEEQKQFILNYFNVHRRFIGQYKSISRMPNIKSIATTVLLKHYSRKVFLQLIKVLFKFDYELSAYIKFDNQQLIQRLAQIDPRYAPTGYIKSKANLLDVINRYLMFDNIPNDIKNNFRIAKYIIENKTSIKRHLNSFFCLFPIEIDIYKQNAKNLYELQNPESVETITDIDLLLVLFNDSKFELYLIEGKSQGNGYKAAIEKDFNEKILPNLRYPDNFSEIHFVNELQTKGGYIKIEN